MDNYEKLSFAFKKMLKRMKIMRLRLKELRKTMNENKSKSYIKSDEYAEMQVEFDCINVGIGYLNIETKRTIIMLKICLYRQKSEKIISINKKTTISSVDQKNNFIETNKGEEKSAYRDAGKQNNLEREGKNIFSIHYPLPSKLNTMVIVDSINNGLIETKFINQKSSQIMNGDAAFHEMNESIRLRESTIIGHVLIFFVSLFWYYKLPESEKIKCKMERI